jgi:putative zinc finger protein
MTMDFKCGDPAALAGYLYDECGTDERAAIAAHLATCPRCASELAALNATRMALASWRPPDVELGFRITSERETPPAATVLRPKAWWQRPLPAWAQAAAALLIFTAGAMTGMRTGPGPSPSPEPTTATVAAPANVSAADLAALERRLRTEMTAMRTASAPQTVHASANDQSLVRRVNELLAESEKRQQRELAFRVAQVMRDVDSQRAMDLSRIERTFGQMEGVTRPELAEQRQMINYLIQRTSVQQRAPQ